MNNSGPAIMMMPPNIRTIFLPPPPLRPLAPPSRRAQRRGKVSGVAGLMGQFERARPPLRKIGPTPAQAAAEKKRKREEELKEALADPIEKYQEEQARSSGKIGEMNCYNTLFVGRLAYEVTERKLLREFETFGQVKDLKLIVDPATKKSRGFAFIEFEEEDDMKRAYREADRMRIDGRAVVADVERGHTVPGWLPRKFGGGLGGTRIGGKDKNVTVPGRWDPARAKEAMGQGPGGRDGRMGPGGADGPGGMRDGYPRDGGPGGGPPMHRGGGRDGPYMGGPPGPGGYGDYDRRGPPGPPPMHGGYDRYGGPPRGGGPGGYDRYDGPPGRGGGFGGRGGYRDEGRYGGDRYGGGPAPPKRYRSRSRSPPPRDRRRS